MIKSAHNSRNVMSKTKSLAALFLLSSICAFGTANATETTPNGTTTIANVINSLSDWFNTYKSSFSTKDAARTAGSVSTAGSGTSGSASTPSPGADGSSWVNVSSPSSSGTSIVNTTSTGIATAGTGTSGYAASNYSATATRTTNGVAEINPTAKSNEAPGGLRKFISSRPAATGEASQITLPSAIPDQSVVLTNADAVSVPSETRQISCTSQYGAPSAGVTYVGGPIVEKRIQKSPGSWGAWTYASGQCLRRHEEYQTVSTCPNGESGTITQKRIYDIKDDGSTASDTGWITQTQTCSVYFVQTVTDSQTSSCPNGQSGVIVQKRTYDLWSDGSKRNYSSWTTNSNTCANARIFTGYEMKTQSCPSGQSGLIYLRRSYDEWSDGTKDNFSAWAEVANACSAGSTSRQTQTQYIACPAGQTGNILQTRDYLVNGSGTFMTYLSDWATVSNNCVTEQFLFTAYENTWTASCPAGQKGAVMYERFVDVWSDGSERNATPWAYNSSACWAYIADTVATDQTTAKTCSDGKPGQIMSFDISQYLADGSVFASTGYAQHTDTCGESGHKAVTRKYGCPGTLSGSRTQRREFDIIDHYVLNDTGWWDTENTCQPTAFIALEHHHSERSLSCAAGFTGTRTQSRDFDIDHNVLLFVNDTGWYFTASNCTPSAGTATTGSGLETRTIACPNDAQGNTYSGSITQARQYYVLSNGLTTYPGDWYATSRNCTSNAKTLIEWRTETKATSCSTGQTGSAPTQQRGYNFWSDGSKTDYSPWFNMSPNTCAGPLTKVSTGTETQPLDCASGYTGTSGVQTRTYDLMADGSKMNYSAWVTTTPSVCTPVSAPLTTVAYALVENTTVSCLTIGAGPGTTTWTKQYDLMSDGSRNYKYGAGWTGYAGCTWM